jgi:hypothetical protein
MKELPVYKITIDDIEESGIEFVSMVEQPAIMVKGLAFQNEQFFKFNEEKQIVAGAALIPDLKIYRYDNDLGEYYVMFEKETIEKMVDKFNKLQKEYKINLEHTPKIVPAFIKGSWIIEDGENDKSKMYGFTDLPVGTWFIEVKVEDKEFWNKEIKGKNRTGFSIEGIMGISLSKVKDKFEVLQGGVASSNVASYRWNSTNSTLILTFHDGSRYKYYTIDREEFENIILGDAQCITSGENEFGRWFEGKSPSVGAAVWEYLRDTNIRFEKLSIEDDNIIVRFESYDDYPQAARDNACKVLRWRDEYGEDEVDGMTRVGWIRANQLCNGERISEETIARMSGFQRHKENSEISEEFRGTPWKDRGYVAWLGWGGTEGIEWASRKLKQIREQFNELNKINKTKLNMKSKKLIFRDYTLKNGAKITIDGDMAIGSFVYLLEEDGTRVQAPEGEHILEDGTTIFVDAEGYINEIRTAATTETTERNEQLQVTPEEVMAVVSPIFDEMRMIIGELQGRIEMLEGKTDAAADILQVEDDLKKQQYSIQDKLSKIRNILTK